jgi:hypothetical protein
VDNLTHREDYYYNFFVTGLKDSLHKEEQSPYHRSGKRRYSDIRLLVQEVLKNNIEREALISLTAD